MIELIGGSLLMSLTSRNNYNWIDLSLNCKDIEFLKENQDEIVWEKIIYKSLCFRDIKYKSRNSKIIY